LPAIIAIALAAALGFGAAPLAAQAPLAPQRLLDDFADLSSWHAGASDGVRASIHATDGIDGRALQLDFDLAGTAGYAIADRTLPLDLPANYGDLCLHARRRAGQQFPVQADRRGRRQCLVVRSPEFHLS
jgi:hypothetical protein